MKEKTMAEIFIEKLGKEIAEKALDEYEYKGKTIREWADLLSKGDIVEVVRCKECRSFHDEEYCAVWCDATGNYDFCSFGERKEK